MYCRYDDGHATSATPGSSRDSKRCSSPSGKTLFPSIMRSMNSLLAGGALVAVLGGACGSLITLWTVGGEAAPPAIASERERKPPKRAPLRVDDGERADQPRGDATSARLSSLERRVSLLTAALAKAEGGVALRDEQGTTTDVADPVFEAAVLDILDRKEERKESEVSAQRTSERKEQSHRFAKRLGESMGLDDAHQLDEQQQEKIAEVVGSYFDRIREVREGDPSERPVTRSEWRERMSEITRTSETELMAVLNPEQQKKYEALDHDDKIGFGRFSRSRESRDGDGARRANSTE